MRKTPRPGSVAVEKLTITLADLRKLTDQDRYSYYLLGHMFNELMCLQKLIHYAMPTHGDRREFRRNPEMFQTIFLFRIALSKISETWKELRENRALKATFHSLIDPFWPEGVSSRKRLDTALDAAPWLTALRNKVGFHFPTFTQLEPLVQPTQDWTDDLIYMGNQSGNVFYDSANVVVMHWMFSLYGAEKVEDAVDPMIVEMIDLIHLMTSYLENSLGVLISESILSKHDATAPVGHVIAPQFSAVKIPFWTSMPKGSAVG